MEILVRRNDLVKELQLVQGIVERKNSIPILSNVLAEARSGELRISATDLDVSLRCGCAAQVVEEGAVTLGAKKLYEIVRSLPESDVSVRVEGDAWAKIRCERVEFKMAGLPGEDFPSLPDARPGRAVDIPVAVLRGLIQRTAFAITAEDARYYLAGALLVLDKDSAAMVATDGHRLAWAQKKAALKVGGGRPRARAPQGHHRARPPHRGDGRGGARSPSSRATATSSSRPGAERSPRRWWRPSSRPTRRSWRSPATRR